MLHVLTSFNLVLQDKFNGICIKRELSTAAAKANSACLLGRLSKIGEGHRQAAKRRVWVRREQEMREEADRAHWRANIRGRGIIRGGGDFFSI